MDHARIVTHSAKYLVAKNLDDHGEANGHEFLVIDDPITVLVDESCTGIRRGLTDELISAPGSIRLE